MLKNQNMFGIEHYLKKEEENCDIRLQVNQGQWESKK